MNCPNCNKTINEHEAGPCLDLWIIEDVLKWEKKVESYTGDLLPEGSYFILWIPQDDHPCITGVSQAFDKDGNNLRANKRNPLGVWDESPSYNYSLQFSTNISATWELLERVEKNLGIFKIMRYAYEGRSNYWGFEVHHKVMAQAETAELAICRAMLKVFSENEP